MTLDASTEATVNLPKDSNCYLKVWKGEGEERQMIKNMHTSWSLPPSDSKLKLVSWKRIHCAHTDFIFPSIEWEQMLVLMVTEHLTNATPAHLQGWGSNTGGIW